MNQIEEILRYFPMNIYQICRNTISKSKEMQDTLQEIRIRVGRPILLKFRGYDVLIEYKVTVTELLQILERICENSIYAYKNQICNGFITIKGGHRIGVTGTAVMEGNKVLNIKHITSLNIRIARQMIGCSNEILKQIIDTKTHDIYNTLIVSPPGKGKTTMLRDLIRNISNGVESMQLQGKTCGVVDERGEIAAMYKGIPQNDIGIRTDVIENITKEKGIKMLIRSMAPEVIACDEIGGTEDILAIKEAFVSGVKGIFTMHGNKMEDLKANPLVNELIQSNYIEKIIFI